MSSPLASELAEAPSYDLLTLATRTAASTIASV